MKRVINLVLMLSIAASIFALTSCDSGKSKKEEKEEEKDIYEIDLDLNEYFSYTVLGEYNGDAYIEYSIDFESLWNSDKNLHHAEQEEFSSYIVGSFDVYDNLSNGDVATWSWDINEEAINDLYKDEDIEIDITYEDITVDVEELLDKEVFNPIDYVSVSFEGISPFITAKMDILSCDCGLSFSFDNSTDLANGDTVTVTLNDSYLSTVEAYCEENNFILGTTSVSYTVENFDEYLTSVDQLTPEMIDMMSSQAINVFYSKTASWDESSVVVSINYDGIYFLNSRFPDKLWNKSDMNQCYILLSVTANNPTDGDLSYYYFVKYSGLILKNDGTLIVDLSKYSNSEGGSFFGLSGDAFMVSDESTLYYVGDLSVTDFYQTKILTNLVDYDYTTTYVEE